VTRGKHLFSKKGYLAGNEAERAEDLIRAMTDPAVCAIICVRGGYGSSRLLPWLPFSSLGKVRKIFLGHSDITFLHCAFQSRMDWATFHGPNVISLADTPSQSENVLRVLRGEQEFCWKFAKEQIIRPGVASGPVFGGNLTCLTHLVGTRYFPDLNGALLLIEDRGEALYRLDRFLTHLKLAGAMERLGGLIIGEFTECGDTREILDMISEQVRPYRFPVVASLPFGHGEANEVIPFGIPFSLNTYERTLKAIQSPFKK
jgi:muramoyltetrapeptide carboxypeptidase